MKDLFKKLHIRFNAPVTLGFALLCCAAFLLQKIIPSSQLKVFSVYRCSLSDPLAFVRLFGHVLGHAGVEHLVGNMMYILLLGPILEEKYGKGNIIIATAVTAVITGIACMLFNDAHTASLGASGVVFAFIVLTSFTAVKEKEIPLTTVLVILLYLGEQIFLAVTRGGNVGYGVHILGGLIGAVIGYVLNAGRKGSTSRGY